MLSEINYQELGLRIKNTRLKNGLTQEQLADKVGCNTSHISNIENNYTKLSLNVLLTIANALNVTIDYLLSNQLNTSSDALNTEIVNRLSLCNNKQKEQILQIIDILIK